MISFQFLILHPSLVFDSSLEKKLMVMFNSDAETRADINLAGSFPYLVIEERYETNELNKRVTVKSSSSDEGYPEIPEVAESMQGLLQHLRSGGFSSYPEIRDHASLQLTFLMLETEESTDRKKFIPILDQFLLEVKGIIVHPEVMRSEDFRSFFSLQRDVVEVENAPDDFDE